MEGWKEFTAKTVDEALTDALISFGTMRENVEYEIVEKESKGLLGMFSKPARILVRMKILNIEDTTKLFLNKVLKAMGVNAEVEVIYNKEEESVNVNILGEDMGILIGKRGQTLDSLQYLTSLVINKNKEGYLKVKLDTENYRERRKETLENLAKNIAFKVKKTHKPVSLEPMNPYERRIIHSALQNDRYVETHSEGDEPFRKIVVTMKKGVREYNTQNNRYGNKKYGNKFGSVNNKKEFTKKYGAETKDYSTDYKKDYAVYLEQKAAAKEAAQKEENK